jgi:hypothetical protein
MNNRKTKLFICITKSNWGGAQKYVFDLATNIPGSDYDITVLLGGNGDLAKNLEKAGIRVINLAHSQRDIDVGKEFNLFFELIKIFKKEKPDIIHLNSSKMGGVGALAGRICGIKKKFLQHMVGRLTRTEIGLKKQQSAFCISSLSFFVTRQ